MCYRIIVFDNKIFTHRIKLVPVAMATKLTIATLPILLKFLVSQLVKYCKFQSKHQEELSLLQIFGALVTS